MVYKRLSIAEDHRRDFFAYITLFCVSVFFCLVILSFVIMSFSENYPIRLSFTWKNLIQVISNHI